jgi:hypothetical protein
VAAMIKPDETLEKFMTNKKTANEMVTLRQGVIELKESEARVLMSVANAFMLMAGSRFFDMEG